MDARNKIWVDGELLPVGEASISSLDRGFTLGDGLFETMRVRDGKIVRLEKHLARLRQGADVIALSLPWTDDDLGKAILQTLEINQLQDAFVRLTISRGVPSERGLLPDKEATNPSLVIRCGKFHGYPAELYQRGMRAIISAVRRNEHSPLANVKSLNYLDNILARQEVAEKGADDALMLNTAGNIACASAANIFFVKDGTLITPPLSDGALPGTMRAYVMNELVPKHGLAVIERSIFPSEKFDMDEAFLTNALMGVMPLVSVDGQNIGLGEPGETTLAFRKLLG